MMRLITSIIVLLSFIYSSISGQVVYVDSSAVSGMNDGSSWQNAYTDLQNALTIGADSVFVGRGTYFPGAGAVDRGISFNLKDSVVVLGGFNTATGDTTLSSRNWRLNQTVLDGDVGTKGSSGDNVYNVVDVTSASANVVLDGFIIQNGNANGPLGTARINGGGISIRAGKISVANCRIRSNFASNLGAGIFFGLNSSSATQPSFVRNSIIENNRANRMGGGFYAGGADSIVLVNTLIRGNHGEDGGGIGISSTGITVINSTITGNYASETGGGIALKNGYDEPLLRMYNSIVWNNMLNGNADTLGASLQLSIGGSNFDTIYLGHCIVANSGGSGNWLLPFQFIDEGANYDVDPHFIQDADPSNAPNVSGNLLLQSHSIAINQGDSYRYPNGIPMVDLAGNERIRLSEIDMGVYEMACGDVSVVFVDSAGAPGGDGMSWATAFTDLQDALQYNCGFDSIYVSKGSYFPDRGTGSRDSVFLIPDSVILLGGFNTAIEATGINERDWLTNVTILDGNIDHHPNGNNSQNSFHVLKTTGTSEHTLIDGFIVQNGNANVGSSDKSQGGGMQNVNGSDIRLKNIRFRKNNGKFGGAMYNYSGSIILENVHFDQNTAEYAGSGMLNHFNTVDINRCSFTKNSINALFNGENDHVIRNTSFIGNSGDLGAAVFNDHSTGLYINVLITGNEAQQGGGMYNSGSTLHIINSNFAGNESLNLADGGGAIYNFDSDPIIENSIIWNNMANDDSTHTSSSIANVVGSHPVLTNCIIANSGGSGSGWDSNMGIDGGNNLDVDPLFRDEVAPSAAPTLNGDYRLSEYSPAINIGDTTVYDSVGGPDLDLDGHQRILLGGIDLGAYESPGYCDGQFPNVQTVRVTLDTAGVATVNPKMLIALEDPDTVFYYTGYVQEFQVPPGVTSLFIEAAGGKGGDATGFSGGKGGAGAVVGSEFDVTPGETIQLIVAEEGGNGSSASGGGGATFIANGLFGYVDFQPENILLIAGGGGGGAGGLKSGQSAEHLQLSPYGDAGNGDAGGASTIHNGNHVQNGKAAIYGAIGGGIKGGYGGGGGMIQGLNPYSGGGGGGASGGNSSTFSAGKAGTSYVGGHYPFMRKEGNDSSGYVKIKCNYQDPTFTIIPSSVNCAHIGMSTVQIIRSECQGEVDTLSVVLEVADVVAPSLIPPSDVTVQCLDSIIPAFTGLPIGLPIDSCEMDTITFSDVFFDHSCVDSIRRTWIAHDSYGNKSLPQVQTIVILDTIAPSIICPPDDSLYRDQFLRSSATLVDTVQSSFVFQTVSFPLTGFDDLWGSVASVELDLTMSCASSQALMARLFSPQGTSVTLFNLDNNSNICHQPNLKATFKDNSLSTYGNFELSCDGNPGRGPGVFKPLESFDAFDGENPAGTWWIVFDGYTFNEYTLEHWSLTINTLEGPQVFDQCSESAYTYQDDLTGLNACGIGTVQRTYSALDGCGNGNSCIQTITIIPDTLQTVMYVDQTASGSGLGHSWTNASPDLWGIVNDSCRTLPDTIKIAEGTYSSEGMDRLNALVLSDDIVLMGGYSEGGTMYDPALHEVIIDGNLGNDNDSTNNLFHVLRIDEDATNVRLHNLTITGGFADGDGIHNLGGGVLCEGQATLSRIQLSGNHSRGASPAIWIFQDGIMSIYGPSIIENNTSEEGGVFDMMHGGSLYLDSDVEIKY